MSHPVAFRRHVLLICEKEGLSFAETAERFSVGIASLKRWSKRLEPKPHIRRKIRKIDLEKLAQDVRDFPDAYQYERAARFGVTPKAIWQALRKLGVTYKKSLVHPKTDADARRAFLAKIAGHEAAGRPVVYIDESGFARDMPRTHGYAPRGPRCPGRQDWHAKGRVNVIGALLSGVLLSVGLTSCNVDADIFNLWLQRDLIPKLPLGSVLVLDNATFHKRADTKHMIERAGHLLEFLPAYSPDLNKIEPKWAQAKAIRRRTGMSVDDIFSAKSWNQN